MRNRARQTNLGGAAARNCGAALDVGGAQRGARQQRARLGEAQQSAERGGVVQQQRLELVGWRWWLRGGERTFAVARL